MKVLGLDENLYTWNFYPSKAVKTSDLHKKAREVIMIEYPSETFFEEVTIPSTSCRCDFFIPQRRIMIEVQGSQHYKFNNFHFKNKLEFYKAQRRDKSKKDFCDLNKIKFVEFIYNESTADWQRKLRSD